MNGKRMFFLVTLVAAIMIFSSMLVLFASPALSTVQTNSATTQSSTNQPATPSASSLKSTNVTKGSTILNELRQRGVPTKDAFLPNFNAQVHSTGPQMTPLYSQSPAPMGIGDIGVMNKDGTLTNYTYNTSSFEGSFTLNNFNTFYLIGDAPYSATFQLNTVLNNVTILGNSSYVYWNQNVVFYSGRTHQLTFLDNIWNFSSPAYDMTTNSIYNGSGQVVPGIFYYTVGPTLNVTYPFTVHLFLNSTLVDGRSAVYFNYSVVSGGVTHSGSYDLVQFNSTYNQNEGYNAPPPHYMVSGSQLTPTDFLLNDAEIMVGGPGGGSTAMVYAINGTMNLRYYNSTTSSYENVRAAYDIGSNTGETSSGVAVSWTNDSVAHLSAGPSFVYGMWNLSSSNSMTTYSGDVNPANAFLFVSQGEQFNASNASWSPLGGSSHYSFTLPSGTYSAEALFSNHNPQKFNLGGDVRTTLVENARMGIYTPLKAMNNAQVANISESGSGTPSNPYMIMNNQYAPLDPLFGGLNDYAFPSFYGVLIMNTNVNIDLQNMPSFYIQYTLPISQAVTSFYGLPSYNFLNYEFYNTSYLSLWGNQISGWFSTNLAGFPAANVIFWNSTSNLVGNNYFNVMDSALLIYNDNGSTSNNVVWGNYFVPYAHFLGKRVFSAIDLWGAQLGLYMVSSGNLVYNNYFTVKITAVNIEYNLYTGYNNTYFDKWNISKEWAGYRQTVNGYTLTGSIFGFYQGGNFWWNYKGKVPYNDNGLIEFGGDYLPLPVVHSVRGYNT